MSDSTKSTTEFPLSIPFEAPLLTEPRGGRDAELHRQTLDAAANLAMTPGAEERLRESERRTRLIATIRFLEDKLANEAVAGALEGAATGMVVDLLQAFARRGV